MSKARAARATALLAGIPLAVGVLGTGTASAHGTMGEPTSRIAACYEEGPESPQSDVCKKLVEENGAQALYDWNEVNIPDADGKHEEVIPDGKLCSAGRDKYSGLDNPGKWQTTDLPSSGEHTFTYTASAPHKGSFELYVTKDGWDPKKKLTWDDLESEPFMTVKDPKVSNGEYKLTGKLPEGKSGQHLIYAIWQRSDSPEAFYSCSDVNFGGAKSGDPASSGDSGDAQLVSGGAESSGGHAGHGDHAAEEAPANNGAVTTGALLTTLTVIAGGAVTAWYARRRRATGAHRS